MKDDEYWSCTRKQKFKHKEWADNRLQEGLLAGHYTFYYQVYSCDFCSSYHIGRMSKYYEESHNRKLM